MFGCKKFSGPAAEQSGPAEADEVKQAHEPARFQAFKSNADGLIL